VSVGETNDGCALLWGSHSCTSAPEQCGGCSALPTRVCKTWHPSATLRPGLHMRRPSNYHDYSPSYKGVCWPHHHLLQPHHPMHTGGRGTIRGCTAHDSLAACNTNVGLHGPASKGCCVFTSVVPARALLLAVQRFLGTHDDGCNCSIFRIIKR
jgi:hypothetical protein